MSGIVGQEGAIPPQGPPGGDGTNPSTPPDPIGNRLARCVMNEFGGCGFFSGAVLESGA